MSMEGGRRMEIGEIAAVVKIEEYQRRLWQNERLQEY